MPTETYVSPEDLLLATLHKVGEGTRIVDDQRLAAIFNDAAEQKPDLFRPFRWHRQYHYSKLLSDTLQLLDLGGSIVRENAPTKYFKISGHTAGSYGAEKFSSLDQDAQKVVLSVAGKIAEAFTRPE
jgi:hypothetical protein